MNRSEFSINEFYYAKADLPLKHSSFNLIPKMKPLILIFGKEADARYLYKTLLEMWSYRVVEAKNVEELLKTIEICQPKLILMDCLLPFEENLEAVKQIRSDLFFRQTPIVVVSGYSQPTVRQLALKIGASDFLVKPVDFEALKNSLQKNIEKYNNQTGRKNELKRKNTALK